MDHVVAPSHPGRITVMDVMGRYETVATQLAEQMVSDGSETAPEKLQILTRLLAARGDGSPPWLQELEAATVVRAVSTGLDWAQVASAAPSYQLPKDPHVMGTLACLHFSGGECSPRLVRSALGHAADMPSLQRRLIDGGWIRIRRGADPRGGMATRWVLPLARAAAAQAAAQLVVPTATADRKPALPLSGSPSALRQAMIRFGRDGGDPHQVIDLLVPAAASGDARALRSVLGRSLVVNQSAALQNTVRAGIAFLSLTLGERDAAEAAWPQQARQTQPGEFLPAVVSALFEPHQGFLIDRVDELRTLASSTSEHLVVAWASLQLALGASERGSLAEAEALCESARWVALALEEPYLMARSDLVEAVIALTRADDAQATERIASATRTLSGAGARTALVALLDTLGETRSRQGRLQAKALLIGWMTAHWHSLSAWEWAMLPHPEELPLNEQQRLWAHGAATTLNQLLGQGLSGPCRLPKLTPRESEVSHLVSTGMTNDQIARRLGLSRWTVVNHLRSVMRKLDCATRVQVATHVSQLSLAKR